MADVEMGEIEELHSKDEGDIILNGDTKEISTDYENECKETNDGTTVEPMAVDNETEEEDEVDGSQTPEKLTEESNDAQENKIDQSDQPVDEVDKDKIEQLDTTTSSVTMIPINESPEEIHEIEDDDDDVSSTNSVKACDEPIELNDSGDGEGDVMIIEDSTTTTTTTAKENGSLRRNERDVIEIDTLPTKNEKSKRTSSPRRSVRNMNKQRSYVESDRDENSTPQSSDGSDVEEILPEDPLALDDNGRSKQSTIVVKDTKRLVEIAAKTNNSNSGKKEPTLVIIDTNSILSGRGPVPMNNKNSSVNSSSNYPALLPMALPAQGMYSSNMRATITPIPVNSSVSKTSSSTASSSSSTTVTSMAPVLPTLTDDMFVVEAPSFIVPYVYEKPPVNDFKEFVQSIKDEILKNDENEDEDNKSKPKKDKENHDRNEIEDDDDEDYEAELTKSDYDDLESRKYYSYFDSPLGKFFIDIGFNLVQEFVQSDLLKQQKRKREREGGQNATTNKTIHSLIKNLEFSKENNEAFKMSMKKCDFCNFKTESGLAMAHHLENPHMKNYVYKCNFCTYEVRTPHDILFHMEAEHAVRGRLERAPAFHQCPNCPFEDNQKGKLSRHLVACMRKFRPERNLEPPIDFEPPAKIPRVPKSRQGLNVSAYQAMKSSQQLQLFSKMQMMQTNTSAMNRGRGRPSLNSNVGATSKTSSQLLRPQSGGMVYKQTIGGGSVLVPANYQMNQQSNSSKNKTVHQPSISITPLPRASSSSSTSLSGQQSSKAGDTNSKNSFVICEICDGYIKDLEQLRNHMQWIHKVKIHPKMIYNRPPLNCQKCQFRFFTDQGLERHLLGSHGLVTSSMQDAANKTKDGGRCPVCGRVYQWKLLNHVARDHNMTLKPAHLSYKCTVCTATFGMYKLFENHVYSAHSVVAKRVMDKKNATNSGSGSGSKSSSSCSDSSIKPLKINDEITIIPQPARTNKEGSPSSTTGSRTNTTPSTSKNR